MIPVFSNPQHQISKTPKVTTSLGRTSHALPPGNKARLLGTPFKYNPTRWVSTSCLNGVITYNPYKLAENTCVTWGYKML